LNVMIDRRLDVDRSINRSRDFDRSIDLEISIDQSIEHYDRAHPYKPVFSLKWI